MAAITGLDLVICDGMSLVTARLQLRLLVVWNKKIPLTSLKKSSLNYILERESAVLFLQFNFIFTEIYPNWVDTSLTFTFGSSETSSANNAMLSSSCDIGSFFLGSDCSKNDRFLCFSGSLSSSLPLDSSSLSIDVLSHSILVWFSISTLSPESGSVDITFGEDCFKLSLTPSGSVSLFFGASTIISSLALPSP